MKNVIPFEKYEDLFFYPAVQFAHETGIDVHGEWKLPRDRKSLNSWLPKHFPSLSKNREDIELLWRDCERLNPVIKAWVSSSNRDPEITQKWDIIFGMVSGYNEDDIKSWLLKTGTQYPDSWHRKMRKLEKLAGARIGWIPSEKTIDKIKQALRKENPSLDI